MNETRRELLSSLAAGPTTGPALAEQLGISRAAVWKHVEALRSTGFEIDSTADGYSVKGVPAYGAAAIQYGLDAPYRIEYHDTIESTNDQARSLAAGGERDVVVVADEQTGGRGRLGREWASPQGGIWASTVLQPELPAAHVPIVTLAAGVSVARACQRVGVDATLKWPNDVLVETETQQIKKLAGILTEMEGEADRVSWLLVGIGLNANIAAAVLPETATSLQAVVGDVDRRRVLQDILETLAELVANPEGVISAWKTHAATLGQTVRVETPRETIEGEAVDIRFPGALVVETETGSEVVHAGDCEHLRPA